MKLVLRREEAWLRLALAACASVSLVALVAQVFHVLTMPFFLTVAGAPSVVVLFALAALARRLDATVLLRNLVVGLAAGALATVAYDVARWLLQSTSLFHYDAFLAISIFGSWITGGPVHSVPAAVTGWLYHYWNGLSFGVLYVLAFGPRPWPLGVGYGLVMELLMLGIFPLFLPITDQVGFIALSLAGHVVYGAVLGQVSQQRAVRWGAGRSAWPARRRR